MRSSDAGAREGLRTVTRGTLLMMIGTIGFVAESFVTRVLLFRTLDPYLYSQLALAIPLAGLASAVGSLGLGPAVARTLPFESAAPERRRIIYTSFIVGGPAALGAGAALALLSLPVSVTYHAPAFGLALVFLAISTAISIVAGIIAAVFQGFEDVVPNALFNQVLNPLLFIVFLVSAERATPNSLHYYDALVGYVVAAVLSLAALLVYFQRNLPSHLPAGPSTSEISRKLLWFAAPLFLVGVLSYVSGNGDILILGAHNRSIVGAYSVELTLARLLQVGIASLGYIFLPVTARFVRLGDRTSVRTIFATATKWMVLVSLPLFLLFFFLPAESLAFVYGAGAPVATRPLQILVVGSFASTLAGPAFAAQVAYGQTRLLFYNTLVSAVVNVGLAAALIPTYGLTGAAIAWAVSSALFPGLSLAEIAVLEGIHPFGRPFTAPLLAAGVPAGLALAVLPPIPSLWLLPLIGIAVAGLFLLAVVFTGSIDDGDRLLLEVVEGILHRPVPFVRRVAAFSRRLFPDRRG